jgi:hypothetical protein
MGNDYLMAALSFKNIIFLAFKSKKIIICDKILPDTSIQQPL